MSEYITLQVAGTRFAVRCGYPSFTGWLAEKYRGFVSGGEPHLRLNVRFDGAPQGNDPGPHLSVPRNGNNTEDGELTLGVTCLHPADFFSFMLQTCLRCAIPAKQPPDLLLHSSGVIRRGAAYLFSGVSGSGKSTVCKLLAREATFTVLHDEAIAIAQTPEGFSAWSTPFRGEMPSKYSTGAPLKAIFFLKHDHDNYASSLNGRKAVGSLYPNLIPPLVVSDDDLVIEPTESLRLTLKLAERVPCYELHFRPEYGFWEHVPQLFEKESAMTLVKGQI